MLQIINNCEYEQRVKIFQLRNDNEEEIKVEKKS
jgi:hypothetical protein